MLGVARLYLKAAVLKFSPYVLQRVALQEMIGGRGQVVDARLEYFLLPLRRERGDTPKVSLNACRDVDEKPRSAAHGASPSARLPPAQICWPDR